MHGRLESFGGHVVKAFCVIAAIEVDGLFAEFGLVLDPVEHIVEVERLGEHILGRDAGGFVFVDQLLRIHLLGEAIEGHVDRRRFQLGGELGAKRFEQCDGLRVGHQGAVLDRVEIGAPVGGAVQVARDGRGGTIGGVHLAA